MAYFCNFRCTSYVKFFWNTRWNTVVYLLQLQFWGDINWFRIIRFSLNIEICLHSYDWSPNSCNTYYGSWTTPVQWSITMKSYFHWLMVVLQNMLNLWTKMTTYWCSFEEIFYYKNGAYNWSKIPKKSLSISNLH